MALLRLHTQDAVYDEEARLASLGIEFLDEARSPALWAQCMHIARRLRSTTRQTIGLWPVEDAFGIPALALHVGRALADLSSSTVAFVDANARWPAARELLGKREAEASTEDRETAFTTLWLRGMLALLIPKRLGAAGEALAQLRGTLEDARGLFATILVDMTGFDMLGDHLSLISLLDGVALVAISGKTTDAELLVCAEQVEASRLLGTILVG